MSGGNQPEADRHQISCKLSETNETYCMDCHFAPDETVVTLIKTGSSGTFSLYVHFPRGALRLPGAIVVLPLRGNSSGDCQKDFFSLPKTSLRENNDYLTFEILAHAKF